MGAGEKGLLCDPGPELRLSIGEEREMKDGDKKWDAERKKLFVSQPTYEHSPTDMAGSQRSPLRWPSSAVVPCCSRDAYEAAVAHAVVR